MTPRQYVPRSWSWADILSTDIFHLESAKSLELLRGLGEAPSDNALGQLLPAKTVQVETMGFVVLGNLDQLWVIQLQFVLVDDQPQSLLDLLEALVEVVLISNVSIELVYLPLDGVKLSLVDIDEVPAELLHWDRLLHPLRVGDEELYLRNGD